MEDMFLHFKRIMPVDAPPMQVYIITWAAPCKQLPYVLIIVIPEEGWACMYKLDFWGAFEYFLYILIYCRVPPTQGLQVTVA